MSGPHVKTTVCVQALVFTEHLVERAPSVVYRTPSVALGYVVVKMATALTRHRRPASTVSPILVTCIL